MKHSLVSQAAQAYSRREYTKAISLYLELSTLISPECFQANITLAKKKLSALSTKKDHRLQPDESKRPRQIVLNCEAPEGFSDFDLLDTPVWCQFNIDDSDLVRITFKIRFEHIPPEDHRKSLAIIEYIDSSGEIIKGPYSELKKSDVVGWFLYLEPDSNGLASLTLKPPAGSASVRLGFRSYYVNAPQRVLMSRSIQLRWNDNSSNQKTGLANESRFPTLAVLPFEAARSRTKKPLTIASVLDKFSHACFEPECDLLPVTPANWKEELLDRHIDMILVESAWHGNNDAWLYRVAKYAAPPGNELSELLRWARKVGVPTVFWNKEDPPNFDRFIDRAAEFDYIFTTDENCVERYRDRVPVSTYVGSLPFAAQPLIHNPRLNEPRTGATSFAGTYYADDYIQRRRAMDMLLRTSARYGLDIFDRMHGVAGKEKDRFAFPTDLQRYIKGSLDYEEMLKAYRRYRVGLNVNSVSDSPTMFSRRVFELLACGTPVVSTESLGIDSMFAGLVPTVENEDEALQVFNSLMLDPLHWLKTSVQGLRTIFKKHTYAHRLQKVAEAVGLEIPGEAIAAPIVVVKPHGDANGFASSMQQQMLRAAQVIVAGARYADKNTQSHVDSLRAAGLEAVALPSPNLATYLRHRHPDAAVAICDSRHYYGPGYLLDSAIALQGAPKGSASTILPDNNFMHDFRTVSFESVANIGMVCQRCHIATLVVLQNDDLLMQALEDRKNEDVVLVRASNLRTRAGFDFTSCNSLNAGHAATRNDLR